MNRNGVGEAVQGSVVSSEPDTQWGYRIWKGYELMYVDEIGCKSPQEAINSAKQEIDKGLNCISCL